MNQLKPQPYKVRDIHLVTKGADVLVREFTLDPGEAIPWHKAQRGVRLLLWTGRGAGDRDAQSSRASRNQCRTICNGDAADGPPSIELEHEALPLSAGSGCRQIRFRQSRLRAAVSMAANEPLEWRLRKRLCRRART